MCELEPLPPLSSGYFKRKMGDHPNGHKRHRNCVCLSDLKGTQAGPPEANKKREEKVGSVRWAVSIIQVHVKQQMYVYSIVLSSAGTYEGEKKITLTPSIKKKKKQCAPANGGD